MDSQVTLVGQAVTQRADDGYLILRFTRDDMNHTTICIDGERTRCYVVESNRTNSSTWIHYVDDWSVRSLVAHVERNNIKADQITIKDGKPMRLSKWLKKPGLSMFPVEMETEGRTYVWRKNVYNQLSMYANDDSSEPLSWFQKSSRRLSDGREDVMPAFLTITNEVQHLRDTLVIACLVLEHRIRMSAKSASIQRMGDGQGRTPAQALT